MPPVPRALTRPADSSIAFSATPSRVFAAHTLHIYPTATQRGCAPSVCSRFRRVVRVPPARAPAPGLLKATGELQRRWPRHLHHFIGARPVPMRTSLQGRPGLFTPTIVTAGARHHALPPLFALTPTCRIGCHRRLPLIHTAMHPPKLASGILKHTTPNCQLCCSCCKRRPQRYTQDHACRSICQESAVGSGRGTPWPHN